MGKLKSNKKKTGLLTITNIIVSQISKFLILLFLIVVLLVTRLVAEPNMGCIQPYEKNPYYWEYRGRPLLLLGASNDDNLFQIPNLEAHLDQIAEAGGNYIRSTMSDRKDKGFELFAYKQLDDGRYDLNQWNDCYWARFENMLRQTYLREIIVQIEIWDRFDLSDHNNYNRWKIHPYNPDNNVNYTFTESGFAPVYSRHPAHNEHPFFASTPKQNNNLIILAYQQRFVDKILSYTFKYNHVLYCIDNETTADEVWALYWSQWIRERAKSVKHSVSITEMWDDWDLRAPRHKRTLDHPDRYNFVEVSQNNKQKGQTHWENFQWTRKYIADFPRPLNSVKIYGASGGRHGNTINGIQRWWRHLIGGAAAVRFHRPSSGLGLSQTAIASLKAARKLETLMKLWDLVPANHLLSNREQNEAYLAASPGCQYALYLTNGGNVRLYLEDSTSEYLLKWINIATGEWGGQAHLIGGRWVEINTPGPDGWVAAITHFRPVSQIPR